MLPSASESNFINFIFPVKMSSVLAVFTTDISGTATKVVNQSVMPNPTTNSCVFKTEIGYDSFYVLVIGKI